MLDRATGSSTSCTETEVEYYGPVPDTATALPCTANFGVSWGFTSDFNGQILWHINDASDPGYVIGIYSDVIGTEAVGSSGTAAAAAAIYTHFGFLSVPTYYYWTGLGTIWGFAVTGLSCVGTVCEGTFATTITGYEVV